MKILVTGGEGFLARTFFEGLKPEHAVHAPSRREMDLLDPDLVSSVLERERYDMVVHAANYDAAPKTSTKDPAKVLESNLRMFFNLARCSNRFGRMVFFGSGAEFGREFWQPRMAEDYFDHHVPSDQYGYSKYLMTKCALSSSNIQNLRLFGVFGKYDDWRYRFIPNICAQALVGGTVLVRNNNRFDFLPAADVLRVLRELIAGRLKRPVYNVCRGLTYQFADLAGLVLDVSGRKLPVKVEGAGVEYSGDNSLLMSDLGGFDFTPIRTAVKDVYDWVAAQEREVRDCPLLRDVK